MCLWNCYCSFLIEFRNGKLQQYGWCWCYVLFCYHNFSGQRPTFDRWKLISAIAQICLLYILYFHPHTFLLFPTSSVMCMGTFLRYYIKAYVHKNIFKVVCVIFELLFFTCSCECVMILFSANRYEKVLYSVRFIVSEFGQLAYYQNAHTHTHTHL